MKEGLRTFIFVLVLGAIAILLLPYVKIKQPTKQTNQGASNNNTNQNTSTAKSETFTSDKLGISFKYSPDQDNDGKADVAVKEVGDKVYVYAGDPPEAGQWVQEFTKDPKDDLATAIKKKFLPNISEKDCLVRVEHTGTTDVADIMIVGLQGGLDDPRFNNNPCPPDYRVTNGIRYFWMDTTHPDKFFFFSIGQYAILAEPFSGTANQQTWQDTFQVTK